MSLSPLEIEGARLVSRVTYGTLPGVAVGLTVGVSRKIAPVYALTIDFAVREATIQMTQR